MCAVDGIGAPRGGNDVMPLALKVAICGNNWMPRRRVNERPTPNERTTSGK